MSSGEEELSLEPFIVIEIHEFVFNFQLALSKIAVYLVLVFFFVCFFHSHTLHLL